MGSSNSTVSPGLKTSRPTSLLPIAHTYEEALEAVQQNPAVIHLVDSDLIDEEMALVLADRNPHWLPLIPERCVTELVAIRAVTANPHALRMVPPSRRTIKVCRTAVMRSA